MTTNFGKDMGNQGSVGQQENEANTPVVDSSSESRRQERTMVTGNEKNDQSHSKVFKNDTGVNILNVKGPAQFSKLLDSKKPMSDTPLQRSQPQQMTTQPSFNQESSLGKEFLQNYANLQQPMFAASGYVNGGAAFTPSMMPPMLLQQPMTVPASVPGMFQAGFMYQTLPDAKSSYPKSHYFPPFAKGSLIMLSTGRLKPIEDLKTADFIESAKVSKQLCLETCKIAKIQDVPNSAISFIGFAVDNYEKEVLVEKQSDHPFYVYDQGWASCKPDLTLANYGLPCQQLKLGDVCVFLSDRIDSRLDKLTELKTESGVENGTGRMQNAVGELNKFLTSQPTINSKEFAQDGQLNGNKTNMEISYKKSTPFENAEKSDDRLDSSFGQPVGKKAKLDGNVQEAVKN